MLLDAGESYYYYWMRLFIVLITSSSGAGLLPFLAIFVPLTLLFRVSSWCYLVAVGDFLFLNVS